jgi:hypothetical protein
MQVRSSMYSWVSPTPTGTEPTTIAASAAVARLVGLDPAEALRPEFALVFSGGWVVGGGRGAAWCIVHDGLPGGGGGRCIVHSAFPAFACCLHEELRRCFCPAGGAWGCSRAAGTGGLCCWSCEVALLCVCVCGRDNLAGLG